MRSTCPDGTLGATLGRVSTNCVFDSAVYLELWCVHTHDFVILLAHIVYLELFPFPLCYIKALMHSAACSEDSGFYGVLSCLCISIIYCDKIEKRF